MTKHDIYKNVLNELNSIKTNDSTEKELISTAKEALEEALVVDLLTNLMLQDTETVK